MKPQSAWARTLLASAALACAVALAGCDTDGTGSLIPARAMAPLSDEMVALLAQKSMPKESPLLIRIFKEEAELEVWKQDSSGQYALLKTYPICRWSGALGPKVREGDRQAPEGFYTITPGQMNPNSNYYLSFNIGFPNAYDRANGRTGAFLMVHGDCSSAGCYAMTDEQMGEIYALGREALLGGQRDFQIQAYPFHMTALNMARHRNNPAMPFWRMIKQGNDIFETTHQEPKVDVCGKHYVFNATTTGHFDSRLPCPAYRMDDQIASLVSAKQQKDDREFNALAARNTATVPFNTGVDGGMNQLFLAKVRAGREPTHQQQPAVLARRRSARAGDGQQRQSAAPARCHGDHRLGPAACAGSPADARRRLGRRRQLAVDVRQSAAGPLARTRRYAAAAGGAEPAGRAAKIAAGHRGEGRDAAPRASSAASDRQAPSAAAPTHQAERKTAPPQAAPSVAPAPSAPAPQAPALMAGAAPVIATTTFNSRWGEVH